MRGQGKAGTRTAAVKKLWMQNSSPEAFSCIPITSLPRCRATNLDRVAFSAEEASHQPEQGFPLSADQRQTQEQQCNNGRRLRHRTNPPGRVNIGSVNGLAIPEGIVPNNIGQLPGRKAAGIAAEIEKIFRSAEITVIIDREGEGRPEGAAAGGKVECRLRGGRFGAKIKDGIPGQGSRPERFVIAASIEGGAYPQAHIVVVANPIRCAQQQRACRHVNQVVCIHGNLLI